MGQPGPACPAHLAIGVDALNHIQVAAAMLSIVGVLATITITTRTAGFR